MRAFFLAFLSWNVVVFTATAARAQDAQLTLSPPLSQAFPLLAQPDGVRVSCPILLNDHTVLEPNAVLRFIYINSTMGTKGPGNNDGTEDMNRSHGGGGGGKSHGGSGLQQADDSAAGGWGDNAGDTDKGLFDGPERKEAKTDKKELQNEVWKQKDLFVEALDHAAELGTTVVYSVPPKVRPDTATIDLPEGMLLGAVDGHVRVLGLEEESRAYRGGIRPGDEIRSVSGGAPLATLQDFMQAYKESKRQTKLTGNPSYEIQVWRPSESQMVSIQMAAPPSIPSFF
jgi:hypothetical protein